MQYTFYRPLVCLLCFSLAARPTDGQPKAMPTPVTSLEAARALEQTLQQVIAAAEESVVAIARGRKGKSGQLHDARFIPHEYATGVVVDADGLVLTNYHVLGDIERNEFVVWIAGVAYSSVKVKAADPWTDLAVLEIETAGLTPIKMGDASRLRKGSIVVSLGNPHAIARDGDVSATWGIVANLGRRIDGPRRRTEQADHVAAQDRETRYQFGGLLQTDCRLVRGTSGGPLLDLDGNMVGLTTSIAALAGFDRGTGYAIPVDDVFRQVLPRLKRGEEIEQGFLGVVPRNGSPFRPDSGVILESVERRGPAYRAGLRDDDEVIRINDHRVRTTADLFLRVGSLPPGQEVRITLVRGRGRRELVFHVPLAKKPNNASRPIVATAPVERWRGLQVDYSTALSTRQIEEIDPEGCVVARNVRPQSPTWVAGIRAGALISHVDGNRVTNPEEFFRFVAAATGEVELQLVSPESDTQSISIDE